MGFLSLLAVLGVGVLVLGLLILVVGIGAAVLTLWQRVRALLGLIPFLPVLRDGLQVAVTALRSASDASQEVGRVTCGAGQQVEDWGSTIEAIEIPTPTTTSLWDVLQANVPGFDLFDFSGAPPIQVISGMSTTPILGAGSPITDTGGMMRGSAAALGFVCSPSTDVGGPLPPPPAGSLARRLDDLAESFAGLADYIDQNLVET